MLSRSRERPARLKGILSRSDLLAVYQRPDEDIRREILADIIEDGFGLDLARFTVTVVRGTVDLQGNVERRVVIGPLAEAIERVDGVIELENHLTALWDDVSPTPPKVL